MRLDPEPSIDSLNPFSQAFRDFFSPHIRWHMNIEIVYKNGICQPYILFNIFKGAVGCTQFDGWPLFSCSRFDFCNFLVSYLVSI